MRVALQQRPDDYQARFLLAQGLRRAGRLNESLEQFARVRQQAPLYGEAAAESEMVTLERIDN